MEKERADRYARHYFSAFVQRYDTRNNDADEWNILQDFWCAWFMSGNLVELTGDDWPFYLEILLAVIDEVERNPAIMHYNHNGVFYERHLTGMLDTRKHVMCCLSRDEYRRKVFALLTDGLWP